MLLNVSHNAKCPEMMSHKASYQHGLIFVYI